MADNPSFFSRIFKFRFWRQKPKKIIRKGPAERSQPRTQFSPDRPLKLAESQRPNRTAQPERDPYLLTLPVDHAIHELWRLRRDQCGWMPMPVFRLFSEESETQPISRETAEQEVSKLLTALSASAGARLTAASAVPPPLPEQEEPEPVSLDAQVFVYVAADKLSAWLTVYPPVGEGREISAADLSGALSSAGVTFGVNTAFVDAIAGREDRYLHLFPAAQGQPPVPGKDGTVIDLFPRQATQKLPVDEFNRVDFTAASSTQNVEKGEVICHISLPTPGVPGRTVLDSSIPTRDGVPAVPPIGRNTALSEDGTSLIATRDGGLEFSGKAFQVNPLLEIAGNVDYSTGSVNFLGDVHVHGDVCSGFTVRAMGNIKVDGVVESCTIEAGGDLVLTKGVQGNNQAVIRAHRDIYAKFLENCTVHAKENLHSECIIGCEVYSDAAVYVQSGRGAIMGGKIYASREVGVNIVGSKTEVRTSIYLGGLPCEDFEKAQLTAEIADLEGQLKEIERQPGSPTKLTRMSKIRMQISVDRLKLNQYQKSLDELQDHPENYPTGRLTFNTAYPGTRIKINESRLKILVETRHSMATLIEGEVRLVT